MSHTATPAVPLRRGALGLAFDPAFGGLMWGKLVSTTGVWIHSIVAAIVIYQATGSAYMAGLVSVVQFGPQMFLGPLSGAWSDRGGVIWQIRLGRVLCVLGSGSVALWTWLAPTSSGGGLTAAVLAGSLLVGFGFVFGGPAMQSIIPAMVTRDELPVAMALNTAPMTASRIAGPAIGALVTATSAPAVAFGIAAATHFLFLVIILLIRLPTSQRSGPDVDHRVRAVFSYLRRDRRLVFLLLCIGATGIASETSMTLAPAIARHLGGDTRLVGVIPTAFGVGAVCAVVAVAATSRWWSARVHARGGIWLMAGGLVMGALAASAPIAILAFAIIGFGFASAFSGLSTLVQKLCPDEVRGRVMALWIIAFVGVRPLAAVTLGLLTDIWSSAVALLTTGVMMVGVGLTCRARFLTATTPAESSGPDVR